MHRSDEDGSPEHDLPPPLPRHACRRMARFTAAELGAAAAVEDPPATSS
jgi:hypothetical protein